MNANQVSVASQWRGKGPWLEEQERCCPSSDIGAADAAPQLFGETFRLVCAIRHRAAESARCRFIDDRDRGARSCGSALPGDPLNKRVVVCRCRVELSDLCMQATFPPNFQHWCLAARLARADAPIRGNYRAAGETSGPRCYRYANGPQLPMAHPPARCWTAASASRYKYEISRIALPPRSEHNRAMPREVRLDG